MPLRDDEAGPDLEDQDWDDDPDAPLASDLAAGEEAVEEACPECGRALLEDAELCPGCGWWRERRAAGAGHGWGWWLLAAVALGGVLAWSLLRA